MGIPSFSRQLLKKHRNITQTQLSDIDSLYIDFNGQIYPSVFRSLDADLSASDLKKKIFKATWASLERLVNLANPKKLLYIAIDGVAPRAKMHQQRLRRFKPKDDGIFDTNCITPGTKFMEDLTTFMKKECQRHYRDSSFKVVFSHYHYPGEGEHKILSYLRENEETKEETSVIVGLDADLFMLMLSLVHRNLYIMREEQDKDMINSFGEIHYVSVDALKMDFEEAVMEKVNREIDMHRIVHDYIFLCFFGGNDFIPHLPSTEIRFRGIDMLLDIYWEFINNNDYLTNDGKIELKSFGKFMGILSAQENGMIKYTGNQMKRWKPKEDFPDEKTKQKYLEELLYPVNDPVNFLSPGWRFRYYTHCFNLEFVDSKDVADICKDYLKMIEWTLTYYVHGCRDWQQHYPHNHAPLASDLFKVLKGYEHYEFDDNQPCSPFEQLMLVLPPRSKGFLPKAIYKLMESRELLPFYPNTVAADTLFANMVWQCKPHLPFLDYGLVQDKVKMEFSKLSDTQRRYNEMKI